MQSGYDKWIKNDLPNQSLGFYTQSLKGSNIHIDKANQKESLLRGYCLPQQKTPSHSLDAIRRCYKSP